MRVGKEWDLRGYEKKGYWFDFEAADRVRRFCLLLRHTKGKYAGKPFVLSTWQRVDINNPLYGWKRPDKERPSGKRLHTFAWIEVPKKNGKSTECGGLADYHLIADGEMGAEVYGAACDRDQARIVFNQASDMVALSPALAQLCEVRRSHLEVPETRSIYRALSKESGKQDGINASAVVFDEIHRQKTPELWEVLEGAGGGREQPLRISITTAGVWDPASIYTRQHHLAKQVRDGEVKNDHHFVFLLEGDENKWEDRAEWFRVNPELGKAKSLDTMEELYKEAKDSPVGAGNFKRLQLNIVTAQVTRWIPKEAWERCVGDFDVAALDGRECYAGLDLSATTDLTALALVFPPKAAGEKYKALLWHWLPLEGLRKAEHRDQVPYQHWREEGWLSVTEGASVDYRMPLRVIVGDKVLKTPPPDPLPATRRGGEFSPPWGEDLTPRPPLRGAAEGEVFPIVGIMERYKLQEIAHDPWNATQFVNELQRYFPVEKIIEHRQGAQSYNEPMKALERMIYRAEFLVGPNPILTWECANIVATTDSNLNIKPDKKKSIQKIDGMCALIMALGRAVVHYKPMAASVYETRGFREL